MYHLTHEDLPRERQGEFDPMEWGEIGNRPSHDELDELINFGDDLEALERAHMDLGMLEDMDEAYLSAMDREAALGVLPEVEGFEKIRESEALRIAAILETERTARKQDRF